MLKLGVIGYGYWGPEHVRNFSSHPTVDVAICDRTPGPGSDEPRSEPCKRPPSDES